MTDEQHAPTTKDGFRKRKKRPAGWMKQAIEDGVIPDPDNPVEETRPGPDVHVIEPPVATLDGDGTTE